jgi:hypothetical protein
MVLSNIAAKVDVYNVIESGQRLVFQWCDSEE